jgi:hypothetical protein
MESLQKMTQLHGKSEFKATKLTEICKSTRISPEYRITLHKTKS